MVIYGNVPVPLTSSENEKCLKHKLQRKSKHIRSSVSSENHAVYEICGENITRIVVFALRQWLRERATMLRNAYNACLVLITYFYTSGGQLLNFLPLRNAFSFGFSIVSFSTMVI